MRLRSFNPTPGSCCLCRCPRLFRSCVGKLEESSLRGKCWKACAPELQVHQDFSQNQRFSVVSKHYASKPIQNSRMNPIQFHQGTSKFKATPYPPKAAQSIICNSNHVNSVLKSRMQSLVKDLDSTHGKSKPLPATSCRGQ